MGFNNDDSKYILKVSQIHKFLTRETSGDETHNRKGFVVICGRQVEKTTMAENVQKTPLEATTGVLIVLDEHETEGMRT